MKFPRLNILVTVAAAAIAVLAVIRLEAARGGVEIEHRHLGETPVTVYRGDISSGSLVVVSHGFAGSRQMMESISLTLANSGHTVVAFDYLGHGRHSRPMSPDIRSLTGTTEDLVRQTLDVVERARGLIDADEVALIGHSMATDVVIRAAERLPGVDEVVAISMYSEAVTSQHPKRLLVVSGEHETRLRE
ncbi:MAG: alpha/beta fold hydrolase [Pseudomonadota bacterium]